jgi:hypothetical protein
MWLLVSGIGGDHIKFDESKVKGFSNFAYDLVQDDPKLPDDGGEIPKSQGRGWWFDSWI